MPPKRFLGKGPVKFKDITERKKAEEALRESEEKLRLMFETSPIGMAMCEMDGRLVEMNQAYLNAIGYTREEALKLTYWDLTPKEEYSEDEAKQLRLMEETGKYGPYEKEYVRKTGERVPVLLNGMIVVGADGVKRIWSLVEDITERKKTEEELAAQNRLLRTLINNLPDSIYVKDIQGRKILTNRSDLDFMGAAREEDVLGKTDAEVYPKYLAELYDKADQHVLREGIPVINLEEIVENPSGVKRCLLTSKIPLKDEKGQITGLVGIGRDITERKSLEVKLLTLARYDTLTQIPNRALFFEQAVLALAHTRRTGMQCAVLFVDIDRFKNVNDILGHFVGDELIKDTAAKLALCIRETDVLARLGGDEFVILLNDLKDIEGIQQKADHIREQFNIPRIISGSNLFVTVSIGIATYPKDGGTAEELLKSADTAMYAAKVAGRNTCCFFDNEMNKHAVAKMQLERGLRDALEKKELALFYQPIVSVRDGKVRGFEALLRWFKDGDGLVFPDQFIPLAEDTGLIVPIGEWAMHEACRFNKKLIDSGYGDMVVSVNVSVAQLRRPNFIEVIKNALDQSGMPPKLLEIEVTESMFIQSLGAAIEILNRIRSLGAQVSLDDFGTGYSSLVHLQVLPIANLKIDRLFIKEISKDSDEKAMIPAIIDLAHKLNLNVVAEGVENDAQLKKLIENHCDYYQGYLLSKPMLQDQVAAFLDRMRASGCL